MTLPRLIVRIRSAVVLAAVLLPATAFAVPPDTAAAAPAGVSAPATTPEGLLAEIRAETLDPARAVRIQGVELDAGPGRLMLESGTLVPATAVGGTVEEMVFLGRGRLVVEPPDDVEAGQLELYTGGRRGRRVPGRRVPGKWWAACLMKRVEGLWHFPSGGLRGRIRP